jgi:hypothetical protein
MLFWMLWLEMMSRCTRPITVRVTVRVPATVYDFAAEKAKRARPA